MGDEPDAHFPEDRQGQITHRMAMAVSDSQWHGQLSDPLNQTSRSHGHEPDPYWLGPFRNYNAFGPYPVGSDEQVADLLARYTALGARTFILDVPASEDEPFHSRIALEKAQELTPPKVVRDVSFGGHTPTASS